MMDAQVIASIIIPVTGTNGVVTGGGCGLGITIVALERVSSASHGTRETRAVNPLRNAIARVVVVLCVVTHVVKFTILYLRSLLYLIVYL